MNSWSSQDGAERSERQPQQQQFPPNPPPATKFFNIDGHHSRLTSALQVVTNALASAEQQVYNHDNHDNHEQSTTDDQPYDDHYDDDEELDEPDNPPSIHLPNNLGGQTTVVATDSDVSNGFVKSGRSLPYVFEANELGKSAITSHRCSGIVSDCLIVLCRSPETIVQAPSGLRCVWQTIRLCHDDEAASCDTYRRKTILMQGLREAVHSKGQPKGKSISLAMSMASVNVNDCDCRFTSEPIGMTDRLNATSAARSSTAKSRCKNTNGVSMALSTTRLAPARPQDATHPMDHHLEHLEHLEHLLQVVFQKSHSSSLPPTSPTI